MALVRRERHDGEELAFVNRDDLTQKAKDVNEQHGDKLEGAVDKSSEFAKQRAGGQQEKIDSAADWAKDRLGSDNEQR